MKKLYDLNEINNARTCKKISIDDIRIRLTGRDKGWALCVNMLGMWFVDGYDTEEELLNRYNEIRNSELFLQTSDIVVHHAIFKSKWELDYMIVE